MKERAVPAARESVDAQWLEDPVVVASMEESRQAHGEWNAIAPIDGLLTAHSSLKQCAIFSRMIKAEAAYEAAKNAALAVCP